MTWCCLVQAKSDNISLHLVSVNLGLLDMLSIVSALSGPCIVTVILHFLGHLLVQTGLCVTQVRGQGSSNDWATVAGACSKKEHRVYTKRPGLPYAEHGRLS